MHLTHIDTCLPSSLRDHHNRDGEMLLGVYVDNTMTNASVRQLVRDEFKSIDDSRFEDEELFRLALHVIDSYFDDMVPHRPFAPDMEDIDEEESMGGDELPQAWFVLSWDA